MATAATATSPANPPEIKSCFSTAATATSTANPPETKSCSNTAAIATSTANPPATKSCSSTAATATSTANPPETKSWADEVDEIDQAEQSSAAAASNEDHTDPEIKIGSLLVDESKRVNSTLSDPDDTRIDVTSGDTLYKSAKRFEDLNLSPELLKGLYVEMKFERPSKIQEISLPMILMPPYKNLIAQAYNGSGKTTCFVLGMLSRVDPKLAAPQALCICPTRELAIRV